MQVHIPEVNKQTTKYELDTRRQESQVVLLNRLFGVI